MGIGVAIHCSNCGYSDNFMLGVGMLWRSFDDVSCYLNNRDRQKILDILENHKANCPEDEIYPDYENKLFRCDNCNCLLDAFYVKIMYDGKKLFETEFKCPKCKNKLKTINHERVVKYPCPECGKTTLEIKDRILWD